jgi:hypothetical protein
MALSEPARRNKAMRVGGMPLLLRKTLQMARLNFSGEKGPEQKEWTFRPDNFL